QPGAELVVAGHLVGEGEVDPRPMADGGVPLVRWPARRHQLHPAEGAPLAADVVLDDPPLIAPLGHLDGAGPLGDLLGLGGQCPFEHALLVCPEEPVGVVPDDLREGHPAAPVPADVHGGPGHGPPPSSISVRRWRMPSAYTSDNSTPRNR